jgi:hypothetical protein
MANHCQRHKQGSILLYLSSDSVANIAHFSKQVTPKFDLGVLAGKAGQTRWKSFAFVFRVIRRQSQSWELNFGLPLKLAGVLAKLHETSLAQLVQDRADGHLDEKVRRAALA